MNKVIRWLSLGLVVWIFRTWFLGGTISAGDIHYVFQDALRDRLTIPQAWMSEFRPPFLFSYPQQFLIGFFSSWGLSYEAVARLVWFWPILGMSLIGMGILARAVFPKQKYWRLAPFIYITNTYFLMISAGGQMGVALGYALAPWTIWVWGKQRSLRSSLIAGLVTAIQIAGDLRVTYATILIVLILELWRIVFAFRKIKELVRFISRVIISMCVVIFLHAYWILPLILSRRSPTQELTAAYTSRQAIEFFSFADLSHTLSLLHPNWPENIFGKVSFFRPEFLVLPIIVSLSLWVVMELLSKKSKLESYEVEKAVNVLVWFGILIMGASLTAGANSPIGGVYLWLFDNVPGFVMFRDPTKFYLLVAMSYALLVPISIDELTKRLKKWLPKWAVVIFFWGLWITLLLPVLSGEVRGTLVTTQVSEEYVRWAERLSGEAEFSRTLWVPEKQRFAYTSQNHPYFDGQMVSRESSISGILDWLKKTERLDWLRRRSVKYLIVPVDTHAEIFLTDREYDESKRQELITRLDEVSWLVKLTGYEPLVVYQIANIYPRVWVENAGGESEKIQYVFQSPSELALVLDEKVIGKKLVINENYDVGWRFNADGNEGNVGKTFDDLITVDLNQASKMRIHYQPQEVMNIGTVISIVSVLFLTTALIATSQKVHT